jgi:hypothetical protein
VLHRLPREVDATFTELQESIIAWGIIQERRKRELPS